MMFICALFRVLTFVAGPTTIMALKNLEITVPKAVISGHPVTMTCTYDLEGAALYSIRWYRAETEFYRYVPKEIPPTRVFPLPSAEVDLELSNQHDVRLIGLHRQLTGEYQCEVSADAPLFHTDIKSAFMFVTDVPESDPILSVDRLSYSVGETIRANCSSPSSYPATNITWYINDQKVSDTVTSTLPLEPDIWEAESASSYIEISTEHAEEMRQYQVGGSFSQTSSAQLKPLYTKNSIQLMPVSEYDYSNFNQQLRLDNSQRKQFDVDYRSQYLTEDSLKDYISRSRGTKPNVRKVYMKPGLGGIFTLRCEANIYDVYTGKSLVYKIKEDTPQIASVMGQESSGAEATVYSTAVGRVLVKISISIFLLIITFYLLDS